MLSGIAQRFHHANVKTTCFYKEMHDITAGGGECMNHGKYCAIPEGIHDLNVTGFSCKNFSSENTNRGMLGKSMFGMEASGARMEVKSLENAESFLHLARQLRKRNRKVTIAENVTCPANSI